MPAKFAGERLALDGARSLREVIEVQQSVIGLHVLMNHLGDAALVKNVHAVTGDSAQRPGEDRLLEYLPDGIGPTPILEKKLRRRAATEILQFALGQGVQERTDREGNIFYLEIPLES